MENLEKRGFRVSRFPDRAVAVQYLLDEIGDRGVGIGGSVTVDEIGIYDRLAARGDSKVFWHWEQEDSVVTEAATTSVYLMSANGISESGQIVNIDGRSNRVSSMCFGHERVYVIIGVNKIAATDEMAHWRAQNIAAPKNARRMNKETPCATGELVCHNCDDPGRICKTFVTLERKPGIPHFEVVIIDEALGF